MCSYVNRMSLTTSELKHKVDCWKIRFEEQEHISRSGHSSFYFGTIIPRTWIFFFCFNIRHLSSEIIPHQYPKILRFWRLFSHQSCIYNFMYSTGLSWSEAIFTSFQRYTIGLFYSHQLIAFHLLIVIITISSLPLV